MIDFIWKYFKTTTSAISINKCSIQTDKSVVQNNVQLMVFIRYRRSNYYFNFIL
jgi:hypothetical protein